MWNVVFVLIIVALSYYRGWLVHNYLRRLQNFSQEPFLDFYDQLLNKKGWNELMIVIPFFFQNK
jgi:hypothetical protein